MLVLHLLNATASKQLFFERLEEAHYFCYNLRSKYWFFKDCRMMML